MLIGARSDLEASGLVPLGTSFPGEELGERGIRWRDDEGRRFILSKFRARPSQAFRLTVYPTPIEKKQLKEQFRVGADLAKVDPMHLLALSVYRGSA